MKWALIDANERTNKQWDGITSSVVGGWLQWEAKKAGIVLSPPAEADAVLLVYAGAVEFLKGCRPALRRLGIEPNPLKRGRTPYVVTGGAVDSSPTTALSVADAVVVGEGYRSVRAMLSAASPSELARQFVESEFAIEHSQVAGLEVEEKRPWLLVDSPGHLARPDPYIDWGTPDVKSDDNVVRVIGSKGHWAKAGEALGVHANQLPKLDHTLDLAPSLEEFGRMPSELVEWPIRRDVRFKIGDVYRRRMTATA